uniref:Uncharacterized protein n=1 Tax=Lates calcarifer TaxID=8187 RepID=A0A4W6BZB0_LATCA
MQSSQRTGSICRTALFAGGASVSVFDQITTHPLPILLFLWGWSGEDRLPVHLWFCLFHLPLLFSSSLCQKMWDMGPVDQIVSLSE